MSLRHPLGLRLTAVATVMAIASLLAGAGGSAQVRVVPARIGGTVSSPLLLPDGTSGAPAWAFASETGLGGWRSSAGTVTLQGILSVSGALASGGNISATSGSVTVASTGLYRFNTRTASGAANDGWVNFSTTNLAIGSTLKVDALPTIASGFGTSPAVTAGSTPLAGSVNVGTGGTATSGVIAFNGTAYPSAPFCVATDQNSNIATRVSASTTQLTLTVTVAWGASDIVNWICISSK